MPAVARDEWDEFPDAAPAAGAASADEWGDFPDAEQAPRRRGQSLDLQADGSMVPTRSDYGPERQSDQWFQAARNVVQGGAQAATGITGAVAGDVAGLGALAYDATANAILSPFRGNRASEYADPAAVRERVSSALTYQPEDPNNFTSKVLQAPGKVMSGAGDYMASWTDNPYAQHALRAVPQAVASYMGVRAALPVKSSQGVAIPREGVPKPAPDPIPTTEQLSAAAKRAYSDAKNSGVVVPADSYSKALSRIQEVIKEEGINKTLHPKTTAVLRQLEESAGKNLSITEAENLRRVIQEVAGDLDPVTRKPTGDAFRASKILDEFDDAIDQLSVNSEARALWSRSRKSQMIDDMIARAETKAGAHYTQAGMEHALRQEFKQLALNPRRMRGFTREQRAAIEKVAKGGPMENTLRMLGKFDPTSSPVAAMAGVVTGAGLAPFTGGGSMLLPALGFGSKRLATRATARNVDAAREALVGRGMPAQRPAQGAAKQSAPQPESVPFTPTTGVLSARVAMLAQELERRFGQPPVPYQRPMTAEAPQQPRGDIEFRPSPEVGRADGLSLEPQAPRYPGGVDFTPSRIPPQTQAAGGLTLVDETPAIPATGRQGPSARPAKEIQAEIRRLSKQLRNDLSNQDASSPKVQKTLSELQKLQRELAASQAGQ